jgi:ATP-dependent DNA helicase RecG
LGISDDGQVTGVEDSNRLRSQIQDIANNCDPRIPIRIVPQDMVLEIIVPEGSDKPYRCNDGFFMRIGPNSQQLNRDEIFRFAIKSDKFRFDEQFETEINIEEFLDVARVRIFAQGRGLSETTPADALLSNLGIAQKQQNRLLLTRAALLFFGREPQRLFPEAYVTCALYADATRATVLDRADIIGTLEEQFDAAIKFIRRNLRVSYKIEKAAPRKEVSEIPEPVFREAVLNALTHRDYFAGTEHIFVHIHPNRIEITNPGGLPYGLTIEELGTRAVPRNRLIADMFYRMGYVERLGSGIHRMCEAMLESGLPVPRLYPTATAFRLELFKSFEDAGLSEEHAQICEWLIEHGPALMRDLMTALDLPKTTAHRRISKLVRDGWVEVSGSGQNTTYRVHRLPLVSGTKRNG